MQVSSLSSSSTAIHTMHDHSNIGALQHDERTRSHKKKPALTKTNSTLLLKLLAAFCVLDSVGAAGVHSHVTQSVTLSVTLVW